MLNFLSGPQIEDLRKSEKFGNKVPVKVKIL